MVCKCEELTELIKTEGNRFFNDDGREWFELIEYHYCPYCHRKYKIIFGGYVVDTYCNLIKE